MGPSFLWTSIFASTARSILIAFPITAGQLKKSYLQLFEEVPQLEYSDSAFEDMNRYLKEGQDYCTGRFEEAAKGYQRKVDDAQQSLRRTEVTEQLRHDLHCSIQQNRELKSQADVIAQHAIPVAYSNKVAKLELIQQWPAEKKALAESIANGSYKNRRWGDVQDIGFGRLNATRRMTSRPARMLSGI